MKTKTVFGDFAVDERGFQVGHKAITIGAIERQSE